jgi:hypothetical protein
MWDLTVANDHDFYVDILRTAVLVHNFPAEDPGSNEGIHSSVQSGEGARGIDSGEVMTNAQNIYYDENGNQVYVWDSNRAA